MTKSKQLWRLISGYRNRKTTLPGRTKPMSAQLHQVKAERRAMRQTVSGYQLTIREI